MSRGFRSSRSSASRMGSRSGCRRREKQSRLLAEALEPRVLMSYTWVTELADTGNSTTNGANLKNILNGTTKHGGIALQPGDTLVLSANATYYSATAYVLPNFTTGTGTITIESSDIYNSLGHLPAGVRVGNASAVTQYMPKITSSSGTSIIKTAVTDNSGTWVPPHDYSLLGLEIAPSTGTKSFNSAFLLIGDDTSNQDTTGEVPYNFVVDRCYIHGYDDLTNANLATNYRHGIKPDAKNVTIENSYISDIHSTSQDAQAIGGSNGLGNFTITNNFLEGTGENLMFGGGTMFIPNAVPTNITITHNYFFKRLVWDDFDPSWGGTHEDVKNLLELKDASHVLIDSNLLQNNWVGKDQTAEAICLNGVNQTGTDTWNVVDYVTITNNVIDNTGEGIQISLDRVMPGLGYTCLPMHDVLIQNNLLENIGSGNNDGTGIAFKVLNSSGQVPAWNLTIDHNTAFSSDHFTTLSGTGGTNNPDGISGGYSFTNNVVLYAQYGFFSTPGEGLTALNNFGNGLLITNAGAGYTSVPVVSFSGGGGAGAAATASIALINGVSEVTDIHITNGGSGYTSAPTVTLVGGGYTTAAAASAAIVGGAVQGWNFAGNVVIGMPSNKASLYPSGTGNTNYYDSANIDNAGFLDTPGDEFGFLSTSIYHTTDRATDGTDPGVNMAGLSGNADFVALDSTLQNYYKFDNNTTDNGLGTHHNATLAGSAAYTSATGGEMNYGLALTGGTSGSASVASFNTTSDFTFSAWINSTSSTSNQYIASTANSAFSVYINTSHKLVATASTGATVTDSTALTSGSWYMVAITYNSSTNTLTLYKNGVSVGSNTHTGAIATGSTTLTIGGNNGSASAFNGTLDEVRYYSSSLDGAVTPISTITQMQWLYGGFGPLVNSLSPGSATPQTNTTTKVSAWAIDHANSTAVNRVIPSDLTFSWSLYSGPGSVTFSANNSNAAQTTTVTWSASGRYVLQLTTTNNLGDTTTDYHYFNVTGVGTVPNAPTNLATTPNTSNIVLTWTDNSTNETSFNIQNSTDNGASWNYVASVAANTTSYTDTAAAADGTPYLYEVNASATGVNGGSDYDVAPCPVATVVAYDGLNYSGTWNTQNGGLGWSNAWSTTGTVGLNTTGLTYSPDGGTHNLQTASGSAWVLYNATATRTFNDSTYGQDGQTRWYSFLMQPNLSGGTSNLGGYVQFNELKLGLPLTGTTSYYGGRTTLGGLTYNMTSTTAASQGATAFVVAEVQFGATDTVNIWVNPTSFTNLGTPNVTWNTPSGKSFTTATSVTVTVANNNQFSEPTFDEIRYGLSQASVMPDPLGNPPRVATASAAPTTFLVAATTTSAEITFRPILTAAAVPVFDLDSQISPLEVTRQAYISDDAADATDQVMLDASNGLLELPLGN